MMFAIQLPNFTRGHALCSDTSAFNRPFLNGWPAPGSLTDGQSIKVSRRGVSRPAKGSKKAPIVVGAVQNVCANWCNISRDHG